MVAEARPYMPPSISDEWGTDPEFFAYLERYFGSFDLDAAARPNNAKTLEFFTPATDGLVQRWYGNVFVNPPYSNIEPWVKKALDETASGRADAVAMLLPANRTEQAWWQDIVMQAATFVYFVRGRLKFVQQGKNNSAPFPSVVVRFVANSPFPHPEFKTMRWR